jgi:ribosomal protein S18 acetylase RimI-like enzyme
MKHFLSHKFRDAIKSVRYPIMHTILYFLAMMPASSFMLSQRTTNVKTVLHSTLVTASSNIDPAFVDWEMREANNDDKNLMMDFLHRIRNFHTVLAGLEAGPMLFKEGETIQSLMPQVPNCHVILAQDTDGGAEDPIGFASYQLRYEGFGPPLMHMEHLYVDSNCRSKGAGLALMNKLALIGKIHKCSHMEWSVDRLNVRGVEFYHRIGAKSTDKSEGTTNTMKWIPTVWCTN